MIDIIRIYLIAVLVLFIAWFISFVAFAVNRATVCNDGLDKILLPVVSNVFTWLFYMLFFLILTGLIFTIDAKLKLIF